MQKEQCFDSQKFSDEINEFILYLQGLNQNEEIYEQQFSITKNIYENIINQFELNIFEKQRLYKLLQIMNEQYHDQFFDQLKKLNQLSVKEKTNEILNYLSISSRNLGSKRNIIKNYNKLESEFSHFYSIIYYYILQHNQGLFYDQEQNERIQKIFKFIQDYFLFQKNIDEMGKRNIDNDKILQYTTRYVFFQKLFEEIQKYFDEVSILSPLTVEYMQQIFQYLDSDINQNLYSQNLQYLIFNDMLKKKFFNLLLNTSKDLTQILIHKDNQKFKIDESNFLDQYDTPTEFQDLYASEQNSQKYKTESIDENISESYDDDLQKSKQAREKLWNNKTNKDDYNFVQSDDDKNDEQIDQNQSQQNGKNNNDQIQDQDINNYSSFKKINNSKENKNKQDDEGNDSKEQNQENNQSDIFNDDKLNDNKFSDSKQNIKKQKDDQQKDDQLKDDQLKDDQQKDNQQKDNQQKDDQQINNQQKDDQQKDNQQKDDQQINNQQKDDQQNDNTQINDQQKDNQQINDSQKDDQQNNDQQKDNQQNKDQNEQQNLYSSFQKPNLFNQYSDQKSNDQDNEKIDIILPDNQQDIQFQNKELDKTIKKQQKYSISETSQYNPLQKPQFISEQEIKTPELTKKESNQQYDNMSDFNGVSDKSIDNKNHFDDYMKLIEQQSIEDNDQKPLKRLFDKKQNDQEKTSQTSSIFKVRTQQKNKIQIEEKFQSFSNQYKVSRFNVDSNSSYEQFSHRSIEKNLQNFVNHYIESEKHYIKELPKYFIEKFIDIQFPPILQKITNDYSNSVIINDDDIIEWRRISMVFKKKQITFQPQQQIFSNYCSNYFLPLIYLSIIHYQKFFQNFIKFQYERQQGIIKVILQQGQIITIDDFLPVYLTENMISKYEEIEFLFTSPLHEEQIDVYYCFLEKYLAKIVGNYEELMNLSFIDLLSVFSQDQFRTQQIRGRDLKSYTEQDLLNLFFSLRKKNCVLFLRIEKTDFDQYYLIEKDFSSKTNLSLIGINKIKQIHIDDIVTEDFHLIKLSKQFQYFKFIKSLILILLFSWNYYNYWLII